MLQTSTDAAWRLGRFTLLPRRKLLLEAEEPVPLGGRTQGLRLALGERDGAVVGRDELVACVWPHTVTGRQAGGPA